jgi:sterol desaturase/sphingolipid hydroxylase (fatty acid hydroxylase superfamily)
VLVRVVVTPRMHGIHHSDRLNETNSNWSSLLSWWDYLHRTMLLDVPQERVVIGVPAYDSTADVTIGKMLLLPFGPQRNDWRAPS